MGLSAYGAGDNADAEKHYSKLISDPTTPQSLRQRAEMMLSLLVEADPPTSKSGDKSTVQEGEKKESN